MMLVRSLEFYAIIPFLHLFVYPSLIRHHVEVMELNLKIVVCCLTCCTISVPFTLHCLISMFFD